MRLRREIQQIVPVDDVITALKVMAAEEQDPDKRTVLSIAARLAQRYASSPGPATHFHYADEEGSGPFASRMTFTYTKPKDEVWLAGKPEDKPTKARRAPRKGK